MSGYYGDLNENQQNLLQAFQTSLEKELPAFLEARENINEVRLWGVLLWPLPTEENPIRQRTVILLKFLRAREWKLEDAQKQLLDTLTWRQEMRYIYSSGSI
jgi:hypothetical protein